MFKSNGTTRPSLGGRSSNSAIVDVVQRRRSDRVAKAAFITTLAVLAPTVTVVAATFTALWLAVIIGLAAGLAVATLVGLVVLIWPGLRLVWYWIGEITALTVLLVAYLGLTRLLPAPAALAVLAVVVGLPFALSSSRRRLLAWCWCAISRHRLRTCFATFVRANRYGSLPWILLARPTRAGERVWVWLRPGLSAEDLHTEAGLARLAVGCWANEVKINPTTGRRAALLRIDITRRNPLTETVTSPLTNLLPDLDLFDHLPQQGPATAPVVDPTGLDLPGIPNPTTTSTGPAPTGPAPATTTTKPAARRASGSSSTPPPPAVLTRTGEDLTEYI